MDCAPWITKEHAESRTHTSEAQAKVLELLRQGQDTDVALYKYADLDWITLGSILAFLKHEDQIMVIRKNGTRHYRIITNVSTTLL